jgi:hypothetical protein
MGVSIVGIPMKGPRMSDPTTNNKASSTAVSNAAGNTSEQTSAQRSVATQRPAQPANPQQPAQRPVRPQQANEAARVAYNQNQATPVQSTSPRVTLAQPQGDFSEAGFNAQQTPNAPYTQQAQHNFDPRQQTPVQGAWNQQRNWNGQGQNPSLQNSKAKVARTWQGIKVSVIAAISALALLCGLVGGLAGGLIAGAVSGGSSQVSNQGGMPQMGGSGYSQMQGQSGSGNSDSGSSSSNNGSGTSGSGTSGSGTSGSDSSSSTQSDLNGTV